MMDMVKAGFVLNLIGIVLVVSVVYGLVLFVFGVQAQPFPREWLGP
jgi:hypothetical protein